MDLFIFKEIVELSQTLSYTQAASHLNIAQGTLSKHVRQFEKNMDTELFQRDTQAVELTSTGAAAIPICYKIVNTYNAMLSSMTKYKDHSIQPLVVQSMYVMKPYKIFEALARFESLHPKIELTVTETVSSEVLDGLEKREVDVGILFEQLLPGNFEKKYKSDHLMHDPLVLVIPSERSGEFSPVPSLFQLKDQDLLILSGDFLWKNDFLKQFRDIGFQPNIYPMELRLNTIASLVKHNVGISILPQRMAEIILEPGLEIRKYQESSDLNLVAVSRQEENSASCRYFKDFIINLYRDSTRSVI